MSQADIDKRITAFGWETVVCNGHDIRQLSEVLLKHDHVDRPLAIVMDTVKGKGFSFSEGNNAWHHTIVTQKLYEQGVAELESM